MEAGIFHRWKRLTACFPHGWCSVPPLLRHSCGNNKTPYHDAGAAGLSFTRRRGHVGLFSPGWFWWIFSCSSPRYVHFEHARTHIRTHAERRRKCITTGPKGSTSILTSIMWTEALMLLPNVFCSFSKHLRTLTDKFCDFETKIKKTNKVKSDSAAELR